MSTEDLWNAALDREIDAHARQVTNEEPRREPPPSSLDASALELRLRRARAYLGAIPLPVIGQGSDRQTFIAAAHLVRGFALSETDAEWLLWDWCGHRPGWDRKWIAQKVKSAVKHGKGQTGAML